MLGAEVSDALLRAQLCVYGGHWAAARGSLFRYPRGRFDALASQVTADPDACKRRGGQAPGTGRASQLLQKRFGRI